MPVVQRARSGGDQRSRRVIRSGTAACIRVDTAARARVRSGFTSLLSGSVRLRACLARRYNRAGYFENWIKGEIDGRPEERDALGCSGEVLALERTTQRLQAPAAVAVGSIIPLA